MTFEVQQTRRVETIIKRRIKPTVGTEKGRKTLVETPLNVSYKVGN